MIETEFEKWCKREGWKAALRWILEEGYTDPENDFIYILKSKLEKELDV